MRWVYVAVVVFLCAGCGADWFPTDKTTQTGSSNSSSSNSPTAFTFGSDFVTKAEADFPVQSDAVTLAGDNPQGWTITITDVTPNANSGVMIDGEFFLPTDTIPKVKAGQSLSVVHSPASAANGISVTMIKVGDYTTTYVTLTKGNPSPEPFTFDPTTVNLSDVASQIITQSLATATVNGENPDGWPVFFHDVTADAGGEITIGDTTYVTGSPVLDNIFPKQVITVKQKPSPLPNGIAQTRVIIGNYSTTFTTTTVP